jgi:hypothetical protein
MIVWGGVSPLYNTGGRYNPATNSWSATSTGANVPSARVRHSAVWTGTEMIIWGGSNGVNDGGRYNPAANSWLPTSTGANAPAARFNHTSVWTGSQMIVWSGTDSGTGTDVDTGGLYQPSDDSWLPTSTGPNLPAARKYHTAVWTGGNMIVWGGQNPVETNSGGAYAPRIPPPAGPANSLRGGKSATVNLTWTAQAGASSYNVRRCAVTTGPCSPSAIVGTPAGPSYSEANDAASYMYVVESVNACGTAS